MKIERGPWVGRRREVADVKRIDQFPIYELGSAMQRLRSMCESENQEAFDQLYSMWVGRTHLAKLLDGTYTDVSFCRISAEDLLRHLNALEARMQPKTDDASEQIVPTTRHALLNLRSKLEKFEHQFSAELNQQPTYAVPDKGIFRTEKLVDEAHLHIHESARLHLPEFSIKEFQRAGRCLAFGLYSASGYHSSRAVESVLRVYYEHIKGCPPKKEDAGLGLMASHLSDLHQKKDYSGLLPRISTVRHLKDFALYDRNPLIHSAVDLEEIDAITLFNGAGAVIVEMAKEMGPKRAELTEDDDEASQLSLLSGELPV